VHVVILILASVDQPGRHVQALAEVVRLLKLPDFSRTLLRATTPQALLDMIAAAE
jgi:mannitol/fructose-specific phosphotransferase system IIA component (Ntr-type)